MAHRDESSPRKQPGCARVARLGFRLDEQTCRLIEQAARLERRKVSDFCVNVLAEAARRTVVRYETLALSQEDRATFFDVLAHPPEPSERLMRALASERHRVTS